MIRLSDPFNIAKYVRFSDDQYVEFKNDGIQRFKHFESYYSNVGLKISKEITPDIYKHLELVCSRLKLPLNRVRAFVVSRPDINAGCIHFQKKGCIIILNSALINVMSPGEILFIIGHEIGHFLMNHNYFDEDPEITVEESIASRAGEISSDRVGLLACQDIDIAIRAIIRIQSGLNDSFLRFDTGAFLQQMKTEKLYREHLYKSTHPSATIRAKALLRFSLSEPYQKIVNNDTGTKIENVDRHIKKDLADYFRKKDSGIFGGFFR